MSAADKTKLDGYASPGWFDAQAAFLGPLVPSVSAVDYVKLGQFPAGVTTLGTNISDAGIPGGGLSNLTTWAIYSGQISIDYALEELFFAFRGSLAPPTIGAIAQIGLTSSGHTDFIGFGTDITQTPTNTYQLRCIKNGGSTVIVDTGIVADTNEHDFQLIKHGNTTKGYIDGVLVAQTSTSGAFPVVPMSFGSFAGTAAGANVLAKFLYGYVAS
jgi:hypothetical protein